MVIDLLKGSNFTYIEFFLVRHFHILTKASKKGYVQMCCKSADKTTHSGTLGTNYGIVSLCMEEVIGNTLKYKTEKTGKWTCKWRNDVNQTFVLNVNINMNISLYWVFSTINIILLISLCTMYFRMYQNPSRIPYVSIHYPKPSIIRKIIVLVNINWYSW